MAAEKLTASKAITNLIIEQVKDEDVESIIKSQQHMLSRFEKTNEMLSNCNALSAIRLEAATREFRRHVQLLTDMKKDLDSVFRRIRIVKTKLSQQYPAAFSAVSPVFNILDEEEEPISQQDPPQTTGADAAVASSSCGSSPVHDTSPSTSDTG
ncbi:KXD1 [Cordylochernes scorpioides]|uniref:KXD1 n=1 Tax=Cordylochernes scorpioides TaxID=51811 RepID=A0ABY6K9H7_9ARAC|nr:KXD1 [Cordylochernes scorpioides]